MSDTAHHTDAHGHDHDGDHHGQYHIVPIKYLVATGMALLVLTVVTVAASWIDFAEVDLRELNIIVAMAIAIVKASLVCLIFMHLRWDRAFNSFILVSSIAFVGLFIMFSYIDVHENREGIGEYRLVQLQGKEDPKIQAEIDVALAEQAKEAAEGPAAPTAEH
ncbi:MAG: cytochrome C oxidase subunit IV family protein [Phycisphaerales bacterium]|nr:cytochrome C oxidase subunit IV family protein [Phycisphaerales bacterium]